jgi:ubiquinone/menaquinone biosynthesis C-methylase UbiE
MMFTRYRLGAGANRTDGRLRLRWLEYDLLVRDYFNMHHLLEDVREQLASAPLVIQGFAHSLKARLKHPYETPGRRMRVSLTGVPHAEKIPYYYRVPFHAQPNGYLSEVSAAAYDLSVHLVFLGGDLLMRRALVNRVKTTPRRILELGCGTGAATLLWARRFPEARIDAVELSPYFLARAEARLARARLSHRIRLHLENAERLDCFPDGAFDLVTSTFLHHELPLSATRNILREACRLLEPGKPIAICDAAQEIDTALGAHWFDKILWEPYYRAYKRMDWEAELRQAGFVGVRIQSDWISKTVFAVRAVDSR